ncbi:MAG: hypothetical protein ACR2RB_18435 [Gammaproteobacteria bacterium]
MKIDMVRRVASRLVSGIALVAVVVGLLAPGVVLAGKVLKFDVAEMGNRFVPDDAPFVDDLPAYGNSFITQGVIYPFGFLDDHEGVLANGEPAYPDEVIGKWVCFGWHVADAATTTTGPTVVTTQIYEFDDTPGRRSVVTEGFELADVGVPVKRPITGGTGRFAKAKGQATQKLLRFPNESGGVDLRFRVSVR